jgi:hypothetical protein
MHPVLLKGATTPAGAKELAKDLGWLAEGSRLPPIWPMRMLLSVLLGAATRKKLAILPITYGYLASLVPKMDQNLMQMILIVVRCTIVSEGALAAAQEAGFLWKLFAGLLEEPEVPLLESALLTLQVFLNAGYVKDYLQIIPHLGAIMDRNDTIALFTLKILPKFSNPCAATEITCF